VHHRAEGLGSGQRGERGHRDRVEVGGAESDEMEEGVHEAP
jgi:hypothetical protein